MNNSSQITKGPLYNFLVPWLGEGLVTSTGKQIFLFLTINHIIIAFQLIVAIIALLLRNSRYVLFPGAKWHKHRKLITPTFHFKILENFQDVFNEKAKVLVEKLSEKSNGEIVDIYPYITHCTLDIICGE